MQRFFGYARRLATPGVVVATPTITVYNKGTLVLARIYVDDLSPPTALGNPFLGNADGFFEFYAANGHYDIQISNGTPAIPIPYTWGDALLDDPGQPTLWTDDTVLAGLARGGWVQWFPAPVSSPPTVSGRVIAPDGRLVDTAGTQTQGLQEAINYMQDYGYDLYLHGGDEIGAAGTPGGAGGAIGCNTGNVTIEWPPMQGKKIRSGAISLGGGNSNVPIMRFDSMMMCDVDFSGMQIGGNRTGDLVVFEPRNPFPLDPGVGIIDTRVHITTVVGPQTAGVAAISSSVVRFKATQAGVGIGDSRFSFEEINGCDFGILIDTPDGTSDIINISIECRHIHSAFGNNPLVLVGNQAGSNNARIRDIWWNIASAKNAGPSLGNKRGFDTRATRDRGFIAVIGGGSDPDIFFEAEADQALLINSGDTGNLAAIIDNSTAKTNKVIAQRPAARNSSVAGTSPFVYPADNTLYARDKTVVVSGGTVSKIEMGKGGTWDDTGRTSGDFFVPAGLFLQITHTGAPTIVAWVI